MPTSTNTSTVVPGSLDTPTPTRTPTLSPPYAMFSYTRNNLTITVDATASTCPSGNCGYSWDFGDLSSGSGISTSQTYGSAGTYSVTLTVLDNVSGLDAQKTSVLSVVAGDAPPVVVGTYTDNPNTWTATVVDGSTDDHGVTQVPVNWGDGTVVSVGAVNGTFTHVYKGIGTFTITHKAIDTIGQQTTVTYSATAAYFTIGGTVKNSTGGAVASAMVSIKSGTTVVKTRYTNGLGAFTAGSLRPGTYSIVETKSGYSFPAAPTVPIGPDSLANVIVAISP